jgi:hypothetical protein
MSGFFYVPFQPHVVYVKKSKVLVIKELRHCQHSSEQNGFTTGRGGKDIRKKTQGAISGNSFSDNATA